MTGVAALPSPGTTLPSADLRAPGAAGIEIDRSGYEVLPPEECLRLLGSTRTGRLALHVGALPTVVPVGFAVLDGTILIGARRDLVSGATVDDTVVAFEADNVGDGGGDPRWSVVVIGVAAELSDVRPEQVAGLRSSLGPWSTAGDQRLIALSIHLLSGRRASRRPGASGTEECSAA